MYTGFKELLVDRIQSHPSLATAGLAEGAIYRADVVYDIVDHEEFLVFRFGEPTTRMGNSMIIPWDILGYCGTGNNDSMKRIAAAARNVAESLAPEETVSGRFTTAEFVGIGADQFDVGFKSIVLVTHMRCVASGY